jgi:DEAD/DEAH box helicase domain-containing protein
VLHEKAIYIVEGQLYQVERFDFDNRKAFVREVDCDYYTDAITYTKVTMLDTFAGLPAEASDAEAGGGDAAEGAAGLERVEPPSTLPAPPALPASCPSVRQHGEVHVVSRVVGFKKIKFYTNENVGSGELDLPEQQMHTTSYWLTIPQEAMTSLPYATDDKRDGVVGVAYAMRNVAPLLLMCDRHDLGLSIDGGSVDRASRVGGAASEVTALSSAPIIYLYDNYPGGIGFSEPLYGMHDELLARTRELIDGCPCQSGCPSCVGPEGATGPRAKAVASHLLQLLTAG